MKLKREKKNNEILNNIRINMEAEEIKQIAVKCIAEEMNADRCFFAEYSFSSKKFNFVSAEYLSGNAIISLKGELPSIESTKLTNVAITNQDLIVPNITKYINKNRLKNTLLGIFYNTYKIKSSYAFSIRFSGRVTGIIVLHFTRKSCKLKDADISFIKNIANNLAIATHQSDLYQEQKNTAEREFLLRDIIEKLRSSLDINQIKKNITQSVGKVLNLDRCIIIEYDPIKNVLLPIDKDSEYRSSENVKSFFGFDFSQNSFEFVKEIGKQKLELFEISVDSLIYNHKDLKKELLNVFNEYKILSGFQVPLYYSNQYLGIIAGHYERKIDNYTESGKEFIRTLASQTGIALYQVKLYEKEKQNAERERLIANILTNSTRTLDINQIKQFVREIGIIMNADRCYFVEVDLEKMSGKPIDSNSEYLSSPDITSIIGYDFPSEDVGKFVDLYLHKKDLVIFDYEKIREENDKEKAGIIKYSNFFKLKSGIGIPFIYMNKLQAVLCLEYVKEKFLPSEDELSFLRILGNQIGIAFNQIQLYQNTKQTAEREALLRKIIVLMRSTLDLQKIKEIVVEEVGKAFNADRCYFRSIDPITGGNSIPDVEYLSSNKIISLKNIAPDNEGINYFVERAVKNGKSFIIEDIPKYIEENNLQGSPMERYEKEIQTLSDYPFPIWDNPHTPTYLVLHYTQKPVRLSEEQKETLEAVAKQVGIAINQAQLYETVQENAANEKLLKEIVSQISIMENIEQIYNYILPQILNIFNGDKIFLIETSESEPRNNFIKYAFDKNSQINNVQNIKVPNFLADFLSENKENDSDLYIENINLFHANNIALQKFYAENNINSLFAINLTKKGKVEVTFGTILLCFNEIRSIPNEEKSLFNEIASFLTNNLWEMSKRKELDELRDTFIMTLAHDLQVPLVGERRALEFIMSIPPGQLLDKYKDLIAETIKNNMDLTGFLMKLVDSYNYDLGRKKLFPEKNNLLKLINKEISTLKAFAESKSISITVKISKEHSNAIFDKDELTKVINTLLNNAITYTQEGGQIYLSSALKENKLIICVTDNGPGVSQKIQDRMFKRFESVRVIERKIGSGLSLYLSKQIIEAGGGEIWYTPAFPNGSNFCFSIPTKL